VVYTACTLQAHLSLKHMEDHNRRNQIAFPTVAKLIKPAFNLLDRFPALVGQVIFYFSLILIFIILNTVLLYLSIEISDYSKFPFFSILGS
jgi:hypothetical protein